MTLPGQIFNISFDVSLFLIATLILNTHLHKIKPMNRYFPMKVPFGVVEIYR